MPFCPAPSAAVGAVGWFLVSAFCVEEAFRCRNRKIVLAGSARDVSVCQRLPRYLEELQVPFGNHPLPDGCRSL